MYFGILTLFCGRDMDTGMPMLQEFKMGFRDSDDVDTAIQSAVEGKIRMLGINRFIWRVIHRDHKQIVILKCFRQLHPPGRITAVVMTKMHSIQIHIGRRIGSVDLQEISLPCRKFRSLNLFCIAASSSEIIVAPVLTICCVPGMGQIHKLLIFRDDLDYF